MKRIFKVAFVIVGTLVGAGFASGKEIYSFFFIYGRTGIIGIFLSSVLIGLVVYKTFEKCEQYEIQSYEDFCNHLGNNRFNNNMVSKLFNYIVNIFLLIMFFVMISAFSGFLFQEFGINRIIGSIIILLICYFTFIGNIDKLMLLNNYLIPFLIIFVLYISFKCFLECNTNDYIQFKYLLWTDNDIEFIGVIKSVLYSSYNSIVLIPVLVQLYLHTNKTKSVKIYASVLCGFIICLLSFAIYNLLLQGDLELFNYDMPIIVIVKKCGKIYGLIYTLIVGIAIFTSAGSSGVRFFKQL